MSARLLFVCTGNAARSVMAAAMTRHSAPGFEVRSAGTFSIPDRPMSTRTRAALAKYGLTDSRHRSRQLEASDCTWAELILTFESEHNEYIARTHPAASARTATLARAARKLPTGVQPLRDKLVAMALADVAFESWEEVVDPAGGDQQAFDAAAGEISELVHGMVERILYRGSGVN